MSHTNELLEIFNTVLKNRGNATIAALRDDLHLRNDLKMDSLDLAELTVRIEAAYGVDVFADGFVQSVGEIKQKIGLA